MIDSFILATSLIYGLKILTKDSQFKNIPNVELTLIKNYLVLEKSSEK